MKVADILAHTPPAQWKDVFAELAPKILATRYLTAVAVVVVIAELIAGFAEEYELIWKGRRGLERNIFLVHRYVVPIGLICAAHITAGLSDALNDTVCSALLVIVGILAGLSIGLADGLVTMEVWQLWDCDRTVMRYMVAAYALQGLATMGFMAFSVKTALSHGFEHNKDLKMCSASESPRPLAGTWGSGLLFELVILAATILNVLSKPRTGQSRLVRLLIVDGVLYFAGVITLRLINLVSALTSDSSVFFAPVFVTWGLVSVLVTRVVMNQSRERQRLRTYDGHTSENLQGPVAPLGITIVSHTQAFELPTKMPMSPGPMPAMNVEVQRGTQFRSNFM